MKAVIKSIAAAVSLGSCNHHTTYHAHLAHSAPVRLNRVLNTALSWPVPAYVDAIKGAVVIRDGPRVAPPELAIARAILHTNPRMLAAPALIFAGTTAVSAREHGLPPEFLGATLLQESAYDPAALSTAGAIGIAQFMPGTAADVGLDPYDPFASIDAAAALLGGYVAAYGNRYDDPYAVALAAYNAGPLAVAAYRGVPPYAQTREYIALIYDRWARIASYEPMLQQPQDDRARGRRRP